MSQGSTRHPDHLRVPGLTKGSVTMIHPFCFVTGCTEEAVRSGLCKAHGAMALHGDEACLAARAEWDAVAGKHPEDSQEPWKVTHDRKAKALIRRRGGLEA